MTGRPDGLRLAGRGGEEPAMYVTADLSYDVEGDRKEGQNI